LRWKLLIAASLLAAAVGAGACYAAARFLLAPAGGLVPPVLGAVAMLVAPLAAITYASIFVYRHTSRRRALQAAATALLASILTLTALTLGSLLRVSPQPELFPTTPTKTA
jgi:hypothetical protein